MMLAGIHLLLTYKCTYECDHCFVFGSPFAKGVMKIKDVETILHQSRDLGTVRWIYFEGGEPFLYYPIMLRGMREAKEMGFKVGVVTDAHWATSPQDAEEWLLPLASIGVSDLSISDDPFHYGETSENLAKIGVRAAERLGLPVGTITIEEPRKELHERSGLKGMEVKGGEVMFRGRAVDKLSEGLPKKPWKVFDECKHEDFSDQKRVHVDPFGFIHLCQGVVMGNWRENPLPELVAGFDPLSHPICGPLLEGGPAALVERYGVEHEEEYVDECHLCYMARLTLRGRFPQYLAPPQMYGEVGK